jgi:hypothetical protein
VGLQSLHFWRKKIKHRQRAKHGNNQTKAVQMNPAIREANKNGHFSRGTDHIARNAAFKNW